jgi:hypothetical protein
MFKGVYESMNSVVCGTFVVPVSWTDIANLAYGYAMTARALVVNASPALTIQHALAGNFGAGSSQAVSPRFAQKIVTGTTRIAVLSQAGGAGEPAERDNQRGSADV